jgi:hypothetical protein
MELESSKQVNHWKSKSSFQSIPIYLAIQSAYGEYIKYRSSKFFWVVMFFNGTEVTV